ncbi:hypothetical protein CDD83_4832 [Cordyceps sp. RAO-2017]|nr:hypothetical protein CDD83_4832 [Cordyceps sp. RAO-2017]
MDPTPPPPTLWYDDQPRFALIEEELAPAATAELPRPAAPSSKPPSSPAHAPSTGAPNAASSSAASHPPKKKGTAASVKRGPKRTKNGEASRRTKKAKAAARGPGEAASDDDESDNGPYCICRGPDDHRWMIGCENCEDWFHGECINITKEVGESLIEKFICPNCTKGNRVTIYKKTCALGTCRKPARLTHSQPSVFCSNEHLQTWWERMVGRLPRGRPSHEPDEKISQDELMAVLNSHLGQAGEDGSWKVAKTPFSGALPQENGDTGAGAKDGVLSAILSEEETALLGKAANNRLQLEEETLLCHKMLTLMELVQSHKRACVAAGRVTDDICGYDSRLDTVSARDAFAAFVRSPEGEATFKELELGEAPTGDEGPKGMCERKRCKIHGQWQKMLLLGIKYQIREMANQTAELREEERIIREAASERWKRKQAEKNWVEVVDD